MIHKKLALCIGAALMAAHGSASAGGPATGGASEVTQIANKLQLVLSYEQQVASYARQGLQLQNELQNLMANPTSMLGSDVGQMINNVGRIMSGAQSIGWNLAQIDKNFAQTFKNPTAANFSKMFTSWHQTNTATLEGALKSIGAQRDQYASNEAALMDLYNRSQSTKGNLDALQTLSQINVRQIQHLQSLQELIATQTQAQATYMASQTAKDEKINQTFTYEPANIPSVGTAPLPTWKGFGKK